MVQLSGLASGLDTASLISQLVAVERAPASKLATQKGNLTAQESILSSLGARLSGMTDALKSLDLASETRAVKATVSDDAHVAIAASGDASAGDHVVRVSSTARAQVLASRTLATDAAGVLGVGSVTITHGTGAPQIVAWDNQDSLSTIAARMNAANAGVSASVLKVDGGYRLVMRDTASGTANAAQVVDAGDGLDFANPSNVTVSARNATMTIDGIPITRSTNVIDDALPGVTFTLKAPHAAADPDTIASLTVDKGATKDKVQKFVDQYNAVVSLLNEQLTYTGTTKGGDTLFGDSTLRQLQRTLSSYAIDPHAGTSLSSLGVAVDRNGKLSIDAGKFDAALTADPDAVGKVFATAGFATGLIGKADSYTRAGDGLIAGKKAGMDARIKLYQKQIDSINASADALETRLTKDFTALEQLMSSTNAQASYLTKLG